METTRPTSLDLRTGQRTGGGLIGVRDTSESGSEWTARPLRPVAHWVQMPTAGGRPRLEMVWEIPDPMPPHDSY
jgi:hypothetical protein